VIGDLVAQAVFDVDTLVRQDLAQDMALAIGAGVDGLISDRPDRLRALLESKGMAVPAPTPVK